MSNMDKANDPVLVPNPTLYLEYKMKGCEHKTNFAHRLALAMDMQHLDNETLADLCIEKAKETGIKICGYNKDLMAVLIEHYLHGVCCPKLNIQCVMSKVLDVPLHSLSGYHLPAASGTGDRLTA